jgi:hypothetical protein
MYGLRWRWKQKSVRNQSSGKLWADIPLADVIQ